MNEKPDLPVILALVSDVYFMVAIEDGGRKLEYDVRVLDAHSQHNLLGPGSENDRNPIFLEYMRHLQPALVIVDLNVSDLPWKEWISRLKLSPATRAIPVVCFGPHVNTALLVSAREAGADAVMARSRFMSGMGEVIKKYARRET